MSTRILTNWNQYRSNPASILSRVLFLDRMFAAYRGLLAQVRFDHPISILSLGSGTGYIDWRLSRLFPTRRITLVDSNPRMLELSRNTLQHFSGEKQFLAQDIFHLKLSGQFDLVHSAGLVEHFDDQSRRRLIQTHADFVAPGGQCIIYAPTPTRMYRLVRAVREPFCLWPFTDEIPVPMSTLIAEMVAAGLSTVAINYFWTWWLTEAGVLGSKGAQV